MNTPTLSSEQASNIIDFEAAVLKKERLDKVNEFLQQQADPVNILEKSIQAANDHFTDLNKLQQAFNLTLPRLTGNDQEINQFLEHKISSHRQQGEMYLEDVIENFYQISRPLPEITKNNLCLLLKIIQVQPFSTKNDLYHQLDEIIADLIPE